MYNDPMMASGIKFSKDEELIIEKYQGQIPVPIADIAKDLGLKVMQTVEFNDSQSGSIQKTGDSYVIYLNASHSYTRKRFTLAHEIAHYLLHKDVLGSKEHIDLTKQPVLSRSKERSRESNKIEIEANSLAADLLMPEVEFKKFWKTYDSTEDLANKFNVSAAAATVRSKQLFGEMMI